MLTTTFSGHAVHVSTAAIYVMALVLIALGVLLAYLGMLYAEHRRFLSALLATDKNEAGLAFFCAGFDNAAHAASNILRDEGMTSWEVRHFKNKLMAHHLAALEITTPEK